MFKLLIALGFATIASGALAQASPYAGQQDREIKALSPKEVGDLLAGQGLGLAKAAELNGYPGPAHVLEHADALALTEQQRHATEVLMKEHKARARALGAALVDTERGLDAAFAQKSIAAESLAKLTADIGSKQAQLRAEHLRTHLEQTALLTPEQIRRYEHLRGYAAGSESGSTQQHRKMHH
jgi:Spy/CpxP family protein refolding chaperone